MTEIVGVMFSDQESSVAATPVRVLVIWSVQVPSADARPASVAGLTLKTALARDEPPRLEKSGTCVRVPPGAIRTPVSPELDAEAMLSETVSPWMSACRRS